ncbi:hypothetical protein MBLNU13_g07035t3 [Cladosporium sp. NU13]
MLAMVIALFGQSKAESRQDRRPHIVRSSPTDFHEQQHPMSVQATEMSAIKFVRSVWESFRANSGLEPRLLDGLRVTAARPGTVNFELDIKKEHTNRLNILHGGTLACMVDLGGSLAVASRGLFATGVSTDLSVTYLASGGKIGDIIRAEVTGSKQQGLLHLRQKVLMLTPVYPVGKTLAYTSIRFTNEQEELVARGSHTKYIALAWKDPQNITDVLSPKPEKAQ